MPKKIAHVRTQATTTKSAKISKVAPKAVTILPKRNASACLTMINEGIVTTGRVWFVKVNGQERKYDAHFKKGVVNSSKLNFHLSGDFDDNKGWRGSRLDTVVAIAICKKGAWETYSFRTLEEAQLNAQQAMQARAARKQTATNGAPF